jgi:hypothetical protein
MVAAQRTSVEVLRRELQLRFQEELENGVQVSDVLEELVLDREEVSEFPLFFQQYLSRGKNEKNKKSAIETAILAGRRVPSRSEGAALPSILPFPDSLRDCPTPHSLAGGAQNV